jgi:hypothetical protein
VRIIILQSQSRAMGRVAYGAARNLRIVLVPDVNATARPVIPIHPAPVAGDEAPQRIVKVRRDYNSWVASETMEDYALRFTPQRFRKWSNGGWPTRRLAPRRS